MEEIMNENLVTEEQEETLGSIEEVTENVEEVTTEETPKTYSEEEFESALNARLKEKLDEVLPKKIARREAKIRKEYDTKYGQLEEVLRAGTGKEKVEEMTDTFRQFYEKKGIVIPQKPSYSDRDIEVLAKAEAEDIIHAGYDEVVEEVERLAKIGVANMSARDKAVFKTLAEHRMKYERGNELSKIGVTEDVYNSKDFSDFAAKFNSNTPITEIYEIYNSRKPKKEYKTMGSMKQSQVSTVKDYYSPSEIDKMSEDELVKDHKKWEAVRRSMTSR